MTLFGSAKFLVDSLDFRQVKYPFVKSFDASARLRVDKCLVVCTDLFLARPMLHAFRAKLRIAIRKVYQTPCYDSMTYGYRRMKGRNHVMEN